MAAVRLDVIDAHEDEWRDEGQQARVEKVEAVPQVVDPNECLRADLGLEKELIRRAAKQRLRYAASFKAAWFGAGERLEEASEDVVVFYAGEGSPLVRSHMLVPLGSASAY